MKLALVRTASNKLTYGKYNIQEIGLAKSLIKFGVSTDIYARFSNIDSDVVVDERYNSKIRTIPLKGKQIYREIMFYPNLASKLCLEGYDVVQLLDESQMMLPYLFYSLKRCNVRTILWQGMYRNFSGYIARCMQIAYDLISVKMINKYADLKIAKTEQARDYLLEKGYSNVSTLGVGLDAISSSLNMEIVEKIRSFKANNPKLLLYIGAVEPRRDISFVIQVLSVLKTSGYGLVLIGSGPDDEKIEEMINKYELIKNVLIFKKVSNVHLADVYSLSDCFVLPTKYEIFGMVILEALYNGIPVIATPEAGPLSILQSDILGSCIEMDTNEWILKIKYYCENKSSIDAKQFRVNYIINNYSWERIGYEYFHRYLIPLVD